jgi:DNA-binding transcriptional LysR family regulator
MDLRQLEMLIAVVDNGGFTAAGEQLHVAQSAISRKIKLLEEELGEALFKRVNKRVFLTPAGETILRYSRRVFQDLTHAAMEVSELAELKRGIFRIGGGLSACMYLLPPVIEKFQALYPKVNVEVVTGPTEKLITQIRGHRLDLGVVSLPVNVPDLQVLPLAREEMVLAVSPKNQALARRRSIDAADLPDLPMILFARGTTTRSILDKYFERLGRAPRLMMESDNVATIMPLVRANLGVSLLPRPYVLHEVRRGDIHYLRINGERPFRDIGLVFQKSDILPKAVGELIRLFQANT